MYKHDKRNNWKQTSYHYKRGQRGQDSLSSNGKGSQTPRCVSFCYKTDQKGLGSYQKGLLDNILPKEKKILLYTVYV